jgi:carotenoid cleavage dioxygenase-like enzyme
LEHFDSLTAIRRLADNFHVRLSAHKRCDPHSDDVMVVGYEDANGFFGRHQACSFW